MENLEITKKQIDENIIQIFVPMKIRKGWCSNDDCSSRSGCFEKEL